MKYDLSVDMDAVRRVTDDVGKKQLPFATHKAINKTLFDIQKELKKQAPNQIDRPKSYTLSGFRVEKSRSKRDLSGMIYFNRKYAEILVEGGTEAATKSTNFLTPTSANKKDKFGNVSRSRQSKLVTDKTRFFFGIPKGRVGQRYEGVWERTNRGKRIRKVAKFEQSRTRPKTFKFYDISDAKARQIFPDHLKQALEEAIKTAK